MCNFYLSLLILTVSEVVFSGTMVEVEEGRSAALLIIVTGMLESDSLIQGLISVDVIEGVATEGN